MPYTNVDKELSECRTFYDKETNTWSGLKIETIYGPKCSIGNAVLKALKKDPEHISQICFHNDKSYKNHEIAEMSTCIAKNLGKFDLKQGDIISLIVSNNDYTASLFFGAMLSGLTVSTMDPVYDKQMIKETLYLTKPKLIFADGYAFDKINEALKELCLKTQVFTLNYHIENVPTIAEFLKETACEEEYRPPPLEFGYKQIAVIVRSSGTSGHPKLVTLTHANLLNSFLIKMSPADIMLRYNTLYWISGIKSLIGATLNGATSIIVEKSFSVEMIPEILRKHKLTIMSSAPRLVAEILNLRNINELDFSNLKHYYVGGCAIPFAIIKKAKNFMPNTKFYAIYGATEIAGILSVGPMTKAGHCGQIVKNYQAKIIDEKNHALGIGETGEICFKTKFPWMGYYGNEEATAAAYDKNGWILSADLGYFDAAGNLFVLERKKDIIKYKQKIIYPVEIEKLIAQIEDVIEVCVCGVPDLNVGQLPAAVIVKRAESNLSVKKIQEFLVDKLEDHQKLRGGIYFTEFIPKTMSGKFLRFRAADYCEGLRNGNSLLIEE